MEEIDPTKTKKKSFSMKVEPKNYMKPPRLEYFVERRNKHIHHRNAQQSSPDLPELSSFECAARVQTIHCGSFRLGFLVQHRLGDFLLVDLLELLFRWLGDAENTHELHDSIAGTQDEEYVRHVANNIRGEELFL